MSAESKIYSVLGSAAGITALVADRIKPGMLPQDADLPAIVFVRGETDYVTTIHSAAPISSCVEIEIWCIAETFTAAEMVGDAVEAAIGATGITPVGRRPEIDPATEAFSAVISCSVWP